MICRFISKIDFETIRNTSTRYYEVKHFENLIATSWIKDVRNGGIKEDTQIGTLNYNGIKYYIKASNYGSGVPWLFLDQYGKTIMYMKDSQEAVKVEKKKFFSKQTSIVEKSRYFEKVILNNREFRIYNICFGKNGNYYVIYEGLDVVSVILISDTVVNYGRDFDLYMSDDNDIYLLTLLYCFCLNMYQFFAPDESIIWDDNCYIEVFPKSESYYIELFDDHFIDKIKDCEVRHD